MKTYLVNDDKVRRAKDILALLVRNPKDDDEREQKQRYEFLISEADVKEDDKLNFVYEKILGGLVRTEQEQKVAEEVKEKIKKNKKISV